ncbi:hypothetical protein LMC79_004099, partial [Salmonella enterica]|nr:hypothetical protein [Salmonella enterica]EIL7821180.1 hypothetical protein [Salmonella enterica]EJQ4393779.1 hypothetical protein [Salmonella enterica]
MKQFSKLKIASAVSLALLATQARAVVQIQDDVSLSGEDYTEALQWMPGAAGNSLTLDKVTVDTDAQTGVQVSTANNNNITVRDSAITVHYSAIPSGTLTQALLAESVTGSQILIENSDLSTKASRSIVYQNELLSDSSLTIKDSSLTGGTRGVSIYNVEKGSVITLDNTHISDTLDHGVIFDYSMNDSALNITNGSTISSDAVALVQNGVTASETVIAGSALSGKINGIYVDAMTGSDLSVTDGSTISSDRTALLVKMVTNSSLSIEDSDVSGGKYGIEAYDMTDSDLSITNGATISSGDVALVVRKVTGGSLNIADSTLSGKNYGMKSIVKGSQVNIDNAELTGEEKSALNLDATDSALNIADSTLSGKNYGLQAEVSNTQVTIRDSVFAGEYGIGLRGRDSDIAVVGTQTTGLFMNGTGQTVDIADSDLGIVQISGKSATQEKNRGDNLISIASSKLTQLDIVDGMDLSGRNTVNLTDSEIINEGDAVSFQDTNNNTVTISNSVVRGNIQNSARYDQSGEPAGNVITLDNSYFEGAVTTSNTNPETGITEWSDFPSLGSTINLANNTTWVAKGESNAETVNITDSTVDLQDAVVKADSWHSENTDVLINSESLLNIGTGSGDMNVVIKSDGRELGSTGKVIIRLDSGEVAVEAGEVDLGAYKYELRNQDGNKWVLVQKGSGESENNTGGESENNTGGESENNTGGESENNTGGESENNTGGESENNTGGESENNTGGEEEKETGNTGGSGAVLSNSA